MLKMIDRRTGEPKASLADPFVQNSVYSYYGAPIPGTMGNIIAYLRRRRALTPSILVNWSTGQLVNWSTGQLVNWSTGIGAFVSRSSTTCSTTPLLVAGAFTCRVPTAANSTR
jgi:hypothetical protein